MTPAAATKLLLRWDSLVPYPILLPFKPPVLTPGPVDHQLSLMTLAPVTLSVAVEHGRLSPRAGATWVRVIQTLFANHMNLAARADVIHSRRVQLAPWN